MLKKSHLYEEHLQSLVHGKIEWLVMSPPQVIDESGSSFYFRLSSFMTSRTLIQLDNQR